MKFWVTDKDKIITFPDSQEHDLVLRKKYNLNYQDALDNGWMRGWIDLLDNEIVFESGDIGDELRRISPILSKIPGSENVERLVIEIKGHDFVEIPMGWVDKMGLERAYTRAKKHPVMANKKDTLIDKYAFTKSAKFWINPENEVLTFSDKDEHWDEIRGWDLDFEEAMNQGWIRGGIYHSNRSNIDALYFESYQKDVLSRITSILDKIPGAENVTQVDVEIKDDSYVAVPMDLIDKIGFEKAYNKSLHQMVTANKKDTLIDEIRLGNWNIVQDIVESLQKELSPEEFEESYSPLSIATELVKLMGKDGLNLAKEYADNISLDNNEKESVFTDGMYSLMRNKSGVPFDMEPQNGPFPRALVPVQKNIGDIAPIDRISFSIDYINYVANSLRLYSQRTGSVLDDLKPLATIWYENEDGDKYFLSEEELMNAEMPEDYPYQHSRNPELREMVCIKNAPPLMEGGTTMNCIGPIVIALVQNKGWDWVDALTFAASTCERCLNILLEETTGDPYLERDTANTWCECCEMIDPEYDNYYKTEVQPAIDKRLDFVGMRDLVASESLMLTPRNTDLAPQVDWRYPERREPNPTGFRPFMTDSPPNPKLKETTEDSRIFFFGPSFNQNLTKIKKK